MKLNAVVSAVKGAKTSRAMSGAVDFLDGATDLESDSLDAKDAATFETSDLTPGLHAFTAIYSDSQGFSETTNKLTIDVQVATRTSIRGAPSSATTADILTLTATVRVANATQAIKGMRLAGSVIFTEGSRVIRIVPLDKQGHATLTTGPLIALGHQIVATYRGNTFYSASTARLIEIVR